MPDEVTSVGRLLQIPPLPEVPEPLRGRQLVIVEAAFVGDQSTGRDLLQPLLELEPQTDTFATGLANVLTELHRDPPGPSPGRAEGWLLDGFDAAAAGALVDAVAMDGTSPLVSVEVRHLEGALGRPDPNGGVLSHLEAPFGMYAVGIAPSAEAKTAIDERLAALRGAAEPWLSSRRYFNFAERDVDPVSFYAHGDYGRLTAIREQVDPRGLFQAKHTIV
jgi:hypothetical protein